MANPLQKSGKMSSFVASRPLIRTYNISEQKRLRQRQNMPQGMVFLNKVNVIMERALQRTLNIVPENDKNSSILLRVSVHEKSAGVFCSQKKYPYFKKFSCCLEEILLEGMHCDIE